MVTSAHHIIWGMGCRLSPQLLTAQPGQFTLSKLSFPSYEKVVGVQYSTHPMGWLKQF